MTKSPPDDLVSRLLIALAPPLTAAALRLLYATVRIEYVAADTLLDRWARNERTIVTFWHNRVLMMPKAYRGRRMCIMNSASRDGEIATRALARFGIDSVRGSASRGGAAGFMQLVNAFRRGSDLAVVPDGPRGPRYVVKAGVIHLARLTGAPLFPATFAPSRFHQLGSWDRLIIPLPFSRAVVVVGEPLAIPRDADAAEVERLRLELESRLNHITEEAERRAGVVSR